MGAERDLKMAATIRAFVTKAREGDAKAVHQCREFVSNYIQHCSPECAAGVAEVILRNRLSMCREQGELN